MTMVATLNALQDAVCAAAEHSSDADIERYVSSVLVSRRRESGRRTKSVCPECDGLSIDGGRCFKCRAESTA